MGRFSRILVLGHTGFIGGNLMRLLPRRYPGARIVGFATSQLDLKGDACVDALADLLDRDTAVVMLAGVKRQFGDSLDVFQDNMRMVIHLGRAMEKSPPGRLVFMSSSAVYGEETHGLHITEESPIRLMSLYGTWKFAAEGIFDKLARQHRFASVYLRPPLVYGPGDKARTYGPSGFVAAALSGEPVTLWGDGLELREMIYIDDMTDIIASMTQHDFQGRLNVVSGKSYSFMDVVDAVRASLGTVAVASRERTKKRVDNAFDADRLYALFPDKTFVPLRQGVAATIAWAGEGR